MFGPKRNSWTSFLISHLMMLAMIFNPLAAYATGPLVDIKDMTARQQKQLSAEDLQTLKDAEKKFNPFGFEVKYQPNLKRAYVFKKGEQESAMEIPFSDEAELIRYSPKNISKTLLSIMASAKPGEVFEHKLKGFPKEAFMFFLAVGGVVAMNLFMNYADNPMALADHIEHQLSPMGMFGFFVFMYSQGVTQNILNNILTNRAYQHFIPYLSMTVGMFAQSALTAFLTDPNLKACAKSLVAGDNKAIAEGGEKEPCQKAFSFYVLGQRLWDLAPSLVSMLASTALAGSIQAGIVGGLRKWAGVEIAMWFIPGGGFVQSVRFLVLQGVQIAVFYWADANFLNFYTTMAWKHFFDGISIGSLETEVTQKLIQARSVGWNANTPLGLDKSITDLKEKMALWRQLQLQEIYTSHQSWQKFLTNMTAMYALTTEFYSDFLNDARDVVFNPEKDSNRLKLRRKYYYLNGNNSKIDENAQRLELQDPRYYDLRYMVPLIKSAWDYIISLESDNAYRKLGITPHEFEYLKKLTAGFASSDPAEQGKSLVDYTRFYRPWRFRADEAVSSMYRMPGYTPAMNTVLNKVDSLIGGIVPMEEPGRGYFHIQNKFSRNKEAIKDLSFPRSVGRYNVSNVYEYMLLQMACGPEANSEKIIQHRWGFSPSVVPPKLINPNIPRPEFCSDFPQWKPRQIYSTPIEIQGKKYPNVLEFIVQNIRPAVIGSKDDEEPRSFGAFWDYNSTPVIKKTIAQFEQEYENINAKMLRVLKTGGAKSFHTTWDNLFNSSDASVVPVESMIQEARIYLLVLGEVYKNSYRLNNQREPHFSLYSPQTSAPLKLSEEANGYAPPLFYIMKNSPTYDFDDVLAPWAKSNFGFLTLKGKMLDTVLQKPTYRALQFQREIERELLVMLNMLQNVRVDETSAQGRKLIRGNVKNKDVEKQEKVFDDLLTKLADRMGLTENVENIEVKLQGEQRKVAATALEALRSVNTEISTLTKMANAINYDNLTSKEATEQQRKKFEDLKGKAKGSIWNMGSK